MLELPIDSAEPTADGADLFAATGPMILGSSPDVESNIVSMGSAALRSTYVRNRNSKVSKTMVYGKPKTAGTTRRNGSTLFSSPENKLRFMKSDPPSPPSFLDTICAEQKMTLASSRHTAGATGKIGQQVLSSIDGSIRDQVDRIRFGNMQWEEYIMSSVKNLKSDSFSGAPMPAQQPQLPETSRISPLSLQ